MRDAGFVEDVADRHEIFLQVKALGRQLRVQDRFAETAGTRPIHQEAKNVAADSGPAELGQHGHAADFHFSVAPIEHPAASDRLGANSCECMKSERVVGVEFDLFGNVLLFDKDAPPNCVGARQVHW